MFEYIVRFVECASYEMIVVAYNEEEAMETAKEQFLGDSSNAKLTGIGIDYMEAVKVA